MLVGRDATCDIIVADRQVSRYHARINLSRERIILEDLSSKNGTHVNGQRIQDDVTLQDGDVIQIALAQKFIFVSSDSTLPLEIHEGVNTGTDSEAQAIPSRSGRLRLDKRSRRVWINGVEVIPHLSVSQFRLLELLFDNQYQVVPRSDRYWLSGAKSKPTKFLSKPWMRWFAGCGIGLPVSIPFIPISLRFGDTD